MEGVNSTRPIRVRQHLVDMATPGVLLIIIGYGLECCQNSRKKGRRRWRGLEFRIAVCIALILTVNRDGKNKTQTHIKTRAPTKRYIIHEGKTKTETRCSFYQALPPLSLSLQMSCAAVLLQSKSTAEAQKNNIQTNTHLQACRTEELDEADRIEESETSAAEGCGRHCLHLH